MKRRISLFIFLCLLVFSCGVLAEDLRIGDAARVANCQEYVTLRAWPDTSAEPLARLPLGAELLYIAERNDGFARVMADGQTGFVLKAYLEKLPKEAREPYPLSEEARYNVGVFLSNFTKQDFRAYDARYAPDSQLVEFALWHMWDHHPERWESGSWGEWGEITKRLPAEAIDGVAERYLGREPASKESEYILFQDGFYYMQEPGGPVGYGFASVSQIFDLGGGRYAVHFGAFGEGEEWEQEDSKLYPEEAACRFPLVHPGYAVIDMGEGSPEAEGDWSLELLVID